MGRGITSINQQVLIEMREYLIYAGEIVLKKRLQYVIDNINIHPALQDDVVFDITNDVAVAHLVYDVECANEQRWYMQPSSLMIGSEEGIVWNTYTHNGVDVMLLSKIINENRQLALLDDGFVIQGDILATLFFHWSRYEEIGKGQSLEENALFAIKNKINTTPYLDLLLLLFLDFIRLKKKSSLTKSFVITHDIDFTTQSDLPVGAQLSMVSSIIKRSAKPLNGVIDMTHDILSSTIDTSYLVDRIGLTKQIYFLVGGRDKIDFPKNEKSLKNIATIAHKAKSLGYAIGIHPSIHSGVDVEKVKAEKEMLEHLTNTEIVLSRQHYLIFDPKLTVPLLEQLNIAEDSSCGYNNHVGFKAGTSYRFYYYNWIGECTSSVVSLPLVWMDSAQWQLINKEPATFESSATQFLESIPFGTICINIHNSFYQHIKWYGGSMGKFIKLIAEK